jgi:hypothetical protein
LVTVKRCVGAAAAYPGPAARAAMATDAPTAVRPAKPIRRARRRPGRAAGVLAELIVIDDSLSR